MHVAARDRIKIHGNHHNWNEPARADDCLHRQFGTGGNDQVRPPAHQFAGGHEGSTRVVQAAIFDSDILAFAEAELAQLRKEGLKERDRWWARETRPEKADPVCLVGLLPPHPQRPSRRAAEQRDELAPFHSITSSARASSVGGMSIPSALAAF